MGKAVARVTTLAIHHLLQLPENAFIMDAWTNGDSIELLLDHPSLPDVAQPPLIAPHISIATEQKYVLQQVPKLYWNFTGDNSQDNR